MKMEFWILGVPVAGEPKVHFANNLRAGCLLARDMCMDCCTPEAPKHEHSGRGWALCIKGWLDAPTTMATLIKMHFRFHRYRTPEVFETGNLQTVEAAGSRVAGIPKGGYGRHVTRHRAISLSVCPRSYLYLA